MPDALRFRRVDPAHINVAPLGGVSCTRIGRVQIESIDGPLLYARLSSTPTSDQARLGALNAAEPPF
jgi:hypothetical protein